LLVSLFQPSPFLPCANPHFHFYLFFAFLYLNFVSQHLPMQVSSDSTFLLLDDWFLVGSVLNCSWTFES
jgi:hypothetical protein